MATFHRPPSETDVSSAIGSAPLAISEGYNRKRGFAAVQVSDEEDVAVATQPLLRRPTVIRALPMLRRP